MDKIPRDLTFERNGIALPGWLHRLVSENQTERESAEDALRAMLHALPSVNTSLKAVVPCFDYEAQTARLQQAIRSAANEPDFDSAEFLTRLCALEIASDAEYQNYLELRKEWRKPRDDQFDRLAGKLVEKINHAAEDSAKAAASKRFAHLCHAYMCDPQKEAGKPKMPRLGGIRMLLFESLGKEIVQAMPAAEALYANAQKRYLLLKTIRNAGNAAKPFATLLLRDLDALFNEDNATAAFGYAERGSALAEIARNDAELVDALLVRLRSGKVPVMLAAANVFRSLGTDVCGRTAEIVETLWPMAADIELGWGYVSALASVGRNDSRVRKLVIEATRPAPTRVVRQQAFPVDIDLAMARRGDAINAVQYFSADPAECVPALVDAIETFKEFDPDYAYGGPVARVAYTLAVFGPAGAGAALPLAQHLNDPDFDSVRAIATALGAMGPAGVAALPLLMKYAKSQELDLTELSGSTKASKDEPVLWAIQQLGGSGGDSTGATAST